MNYDILGVNPLLRFNFEKTGKAIPNMSVSRTVPALGLDRNGAMVVVGPNKPRMVCDGATGHMEGLLLEHQTTNLLPYSEDLTNAAWINTNTTTVAVSDSTAPIAGAKVCEVTSQTGLTTDTYLAALINIDPELDCTYSIFVKNVSSQKVNISFINSPAQTIKHEYLFDFATETGEILGGDRAAAAGTIWEKCAGVQKLQNGWYRLWIHTKRNSSIDNIQPSVSPVGVAGAKIRVCCPQVEIGRSMSSYIANTGAATTTRTTDNSIVVSIPKTNEFTVAVKARYGRNNQHHFAANSAGVNMLSIVGSNNGASVGAYVDYRIVNHDSIGIAAMTDAGKSTTTVLSLSPSLVVAGNDAGAASFRQKQIALSNIFFDSFNLGSAETNIHAPIVIKDFIFFNKALSMQQCIDLVEMMKD